MTKSEARVAKHTLAERFEAKVDRSGGSNACHLWTATTTAKGYGQVNTGRRLASAHRVAWELANGVIPVGMCVCHTCDIRACCNPAHLFLGTQAENLADMRAKGRGVRMDDSRRARGERHGVAKMNEARVREARRRLASGETQTSIAREMGVDQTTIGDIHRGEAWAHVV